MAACNVWLSRNNYYKCVRNRFELRGNDNEKQIVKARIKRTQLVMEATATSVRNLTKRRAAQQKGGFETG